jgi:hypothetical protein
VANKPSEHGVGLPRQLAAPQTAPPYGVASVSGVTCHGCLLRLLCRGGTVAWRPVVGNQTPPAKLYIFHWPHMQLTHVNPTCKWVSNDIYLKLQSFNDTYPNFLKQNNCGVRTQNLCINKNAFPK